MLPDIGAVLNALKLGGKRAFQSIKSDFSICHVDILSSFEARSDIFGKEKLIICARR